MICSHTSPFLHGLRCVAATLMLMPFLALCVMSPAAMLERNASGLLVMVLCTGDGAVEMAVDLGTGNKTDAPQIKQRCDWAAAHATVLDAAPFALPTAAVTHHRATATLANPVWRAAFDPRNLWARGPPNLV